MKLKRWLLALTAALALCLLGAVPAGAEEIPDVTQYSYTVTPILSPFTYYLYVQTDNPDPYSFRLVDPESVYYEEDSHSAIYGTLGETTYYCNADPGTYYINANLYPDVAYEDESIYRVAGGYIFQTYYAFSDGGEFILLQKTASGSNFTQDAFEQTEVTIPCQALQTRTTYLIETYTSKDKTLFENLDAVVAALNEISIYPRGVYDITKPNEDRPYPLLAVSPYPELSLNEHYEMYETLHCGLLSSAVYPFVLDSLGFPGSIAAVAEALEPECEADSGSYHYQVEVTFGGESRTYGGAGNGGRDPLYTNRVDTEFSFKGSDPDTVQEYCDLLQSYREPAAEDAQQYWDLIQGETFRQTIQAAGGSWIKVATEGWGYGISLSYVASCANGTTILSETWVDGRYIGIHEALVLGAKFEDYPTANILLHDISFTDRYGNACTCDVLYEYDEETDTWAAATAYYGYHGDISQLPEELILTRNEVNALELDANSAHLPEHCLVYDGTEAPGTPFDLAVVTGVSVPETAKVTVGHEKTLTATVQPTDAFDDGVEWISSDPEVVEVLSPSSGLIAGRKEGTAVLTVYTDDGNYCASCTVTVLPYLFQDVQETDYYYESVLWAVEEDITTGIDSSHFAPQNVCTRAQVVTFLWRAAGCPAPQSDENPFVDVNEDVGFWYYDAVLWAVENGITIGRDLTHFAPDETCTRAEVCMFLWRALEKPSAGTVNPFLDVASGHWFYDCVLWAVDANVTTGTDTTHFSPDDPCVRGQIVTFLYRAFAQ